MRFWKSFLAETDGATAVEYAILLAMLVLVSVTTMGGFGGGVRNIYLLISDAISTPVVD